jgi:general secretion pathway protein H
MAQQRTSSGLRDKGREAEAGYTLLEVVCALGILALLASIMLPATSLSSSRVRLESYAVAIAALLKADRDAARRRQGSIATEVNAAGRRIRSGATGRVVNVPEEVQLDALLPATCSGVRTAGAIVFLPSGMSCGGAIALTRSQQGFEIRVNWLTGGVEIVPVN